MSEFDKIKEPKGMIKVYLEDVDCTAIAMTSDAGACSLMNEPFLLKSREKDISLTEDQIEILQKIGEYEIITKQPKEEEVMDEKVLKDLNAKIDTLLSANEKAETENVELKKQLKEDGIKKEIETFGFENETEILKDLMTLESMVEVVKAFTFLKGQIKEKVEDTELQKELDNESGSDAEAETVVKDLNTRIIEARKAEEK